MGHHLAESDEAPDGVVAVRGRAEDRHRVVTPLGRVKPLGEEKRQRATHDGRQVERERGAPAAERQIGGDGGVVDRRQRRREDRLGALARVEDAARRLELRERRDRGHGAPVGHLQQARLQQQRRRRGMSGRHARAVAATNAISASSAGVSPVRADPGSPAARNG